jgi:hypothetical protein
MLALFSRLFCRLRPDGVRANEALVFLKVFRLGLFVDGGPCDYDGPCEYGHTCRFHQVLKFLRSQGIIQSANEQLSQPVETAEKSAKHKGSK